MTDSHFHVYNFPALSTEEEHTQQLTERNALEDLGYVPNCPHIPYVVHYIGNRVPIGLWSTVMFWSTVVHYIGNRVP